VLLAGSGLSTEEGEAATGWAGEELAVESHNNDNVADMTRSFDDFNQAKATGEGADQQAEA
jgi:hypothetical protein